MTQDDIIRMAREAGIGGISEHYGFVPFNSFGAKELERFAALVAANLFTYDQVKAHIQAAVITEREACAKVCEEFVDPDPDWDSSFWDQACMGSAAAIRNRGGV